MKKIWRIAILIVFLLKISKKVVNDDIVVNVFIVFSSNNDNNADNIKNQLK